MSLWTTCNIKNKIGENQKPRFEKNKPTEAAKEKKKEKEEKRMDFGLSWYSTGALKAVQDLVIRAEVRSVLDSVENQVIDDATAGIYDDLLCNSIGARSTKRAQGENARLREVCVDQ